MEALGLWNETEWYVQLLVNVLFYVLPTLALLAVANKSGAKVVETTRALLKTIRPAIDEPGDWLVLEIASRTGRKPEAVSAFLRDNVDKVIATLPQEAVK
jgi:hypothetical protein